MLFQAKTGDPFSVPDCGGDNPVSLLVTQNNSGRQFKNEPSGFVID
jgi:hypothetical protein